jgi:hypothetical protein
MTAIKRLGRRLSYADKTLVERVRRGLWSIGTRVIRGGQYAVSDDYNLWMSTPDDRRSYRIASADNVETVKQITQQMMDNPRVPVGATLQIVAEGDFTSDGHRAVDKSVPGDPWKEPEPNHDKLVLQAWRKMGGGGGGAYRTGTLHWVEDRELVGTHTRNGKRHAFGPLSSVLDRYQPM